MISNYNWRKGFFSSTYEIYGQMGIVGKLTNKAFSSTAEASWNNHNYRFSTKGFIRQETEIMDMKSMKLIGRIKYGAWGNKATIECKGKIYNWKYGNIFNTKWEITGDKGVEVNSQGGSTKGVFEVNSDNELLPLCGLYIHNYMQIITAVVIMCAVMASSSSLFTVFR